MFTAHVLVLGLYQIVVLDYLTEYEQFCELFGRIRIRIRIALAAEHFDAAPVILIFIISLNSCGCLYDRCLL